MRRKAYIIGIVASVLLVSVVFAQTLSEYPDSIKALSIKDQAKFIQFARDHGWERQFIVGAQNDGVKVIDGLGDEFILPWSSFFSYTASLGWTNGQLSEFFTANNIAPAEDYPGSVEGLTAEQKIAFARFVARKGWYQYNIIAIDTTNKKITLLDGLGNTSQISFNEFYSRTERWKNEELWEWWALRGMEKRVGREAVSTGGIIGAILISAIAVAGLLGLEWLMRNRKKNRGAPEEIQ